MKLWFKESWIHQGAHCGQKMIHLNQRLTLMSTIHSMELCTIKIEHVATWKGPRLDRCLKEDGVERAKRKRVVKTRLRYQEKKFCLESQSEFSTQISSVQKEERMRELQCVKAAEWRTHRGSLSGEWFPPIGVIKGEWWTATSPFDVFLHVFHLSCIWTYPDLQLPLSSIWQFATWRKTLRSCCISHLACTCRRAW